MDMNVSFFFEDSIFSVVYDDLVPSEIDIEHASMRMLADRPTKCVHGNPPTEHPRPTFFDRNFIFHYFLLKVFLDKSIAALNTSFYYKFFCFVSKIISKRDD